MKKPLNVFYKKKHVGVLQKKEDDTLGFTYSSEWLADANSFELSPALPLQEEPFNNRLTKAFFDNLLPEGETLKIFAQTLKKSFEDPYQILEKYGLDCAGALEITPQDLPPENSLKGDLLKLSYDEIDRVIDSQGSLYVHSLVKHQGRFSLAGAQDKIPVIFRGGEVYLALDASPTTHILKPPTRISGVLNSVQNEYLCMRLADLCQLNVPKIQLAGKEHLLFLIERYDRKVVNGQIERLHQFDLCQAQGYPSAEKYEEDGGPSFAQNYKTIEKISDYKIHDLEASVRWLAFNLLIGNNDSHSKNLSFLYTDGETRLAPMYDLLSTSIYKSMSSEFAFLIGGQRNPLKMKRKNFEILAGDLGFEKNKDLFLKVMSEVVSKVQEQVDVLWAEISGDDRFKHIQKGLLKEIQSRLNFYQGL